MKYDFRFWGLMVILFIIGIVAGMWWLVFLTLACVVAYLIASVIAARRVKRAHARTK